MALIDNQYGGVNLQATVASLDKRLTALEQSTADSGLAAQVATLAAEVSALRVAMPAKESAKA